MQPTSKTKHCATQYDPKDIYECNNSSSTRFSHSIILLAALTSVPSPLSVADITEVLHISLTKTT